MRTLSRRRRRSCSAASSSLAPGWPGTPTATSSRTRFSTRSSARRAWRTSALSFPRGTPSGRARRRSHSLARVRGGSRGRLGARQCRLRPHRRGAADRPGADEMRRRLAGALEVGVDTIAVRATTTDGSASRAAARGSPRRRSPCYAGRSRIEMRAQVAKFVGFALVAAAVAQELASRAPRARGTGGSRASSPTTFARRPWSASGRRGGTRTNRASSPTASSGWAGRSTWARRAPDAGTRGMRSRSTRSSPTRCQARAPEPDRGLGGDAGRRDPRRHALSGPAPGPGLCARLRCTIRSPRSSGGSTPTARPSSEKIPLDARVILICREGFSLRARRLQLQELGFEDATDVIGGVEDVEESRPPGATAGERGRRRARTRPSRASAATASASSSASRPRPPRRRAAASPRAAGGTSPRSAPACAAARSAGRATGTRRRAGRRRSGERARGRPSRRGP